MDQNRGKIFNLFAAFLFGCSSLFATDVRLSDYIYVVPQTLIHSFESISFRSDSDAEKKNPQKEVPVCIYVETNTFFTAPNYLLERVIYIKHTIRKTSTENINKIPSKTENKQSVPRDVDDRLMSLIPLGGIPVNDAKHFTEITVNVSTPNIKKININTIIVSKSYTDFFSTGNQVRTVVFCKNQQCHFFFESQDDITRPPPFFLTQF